MVIQGEEITPREKEKKMKVQYQENHEGLAVLIDGIEAYQVIPVAYGYELYDLTVIDQEITEPVAYFSSMLDVRNAMCLLTLKQAVTM